MTNKVLFVTSGQPSLNPRLVKEADALADADYQVTVLYSYWNAWGDVFTRQLLLPKKWNAICVGGHPTETPLVYFLSRLIHKLAKWIFIGLRLNFLAEPAAARSTWFLIKEAKKHPADLYIGHNLGALPAIVKAAKKHAAKCGFDAEDFHRNEVSDDINSFNFKITKYLEDKYLTGVNYITASSPLIAEAYQQLYPGKNPVTILNVFPKNKSLKQRNINNSGPVKIFWFSQTLGTNRGIEDVAAALTFLNSENFELHLLGHIENAAKQEFIDNVLPGIENVYFHDPILPDEIIDFAAGFDIGLASEQTIPLNRDICLTNKLFTYLQAGLAILASDTTAQKKFIAENPDVGEIYYTTNPQSLIAVLSNYHLNRESLLNACKASLRTGLEKLNWENESQKFLLVIKETLKKN